MVAVVSRVIADCSTQEQETQNGGEVPFATLGGKQGALGSHGRHGEVVQIGHPKVLVRRRVRELHLPAKSPNTQATSGQSHTRPCTHSTCTHGNVVPQ